MASCFALWRDGRVVCSAYQRDGDWQTVPGLPSLGQGGLGKGGRGLTILIDGLSVLSFDVPLRARTEAEARKAAPFMVEDDLASPIENIHVALGPKPAPAKKQDGQASPMGTAGSGEALRTVMVMDKADIAELVASLDTLDLGNADISPLHALLPDGEHVFAFGDIILRRHGPRSYACETSLGDSVLAAMLGDVTTAHHHGLEPVTSLASSTTSSADTDQAERLQALLTLNGDRPIIGLREGAFAPKREANPLSLKAWRGAGILAASALAASFCLSLFSLHGTLQKEERLDKAISDYLAAGYPEANGDVNRALASVRQSRTGGGGPAISALALSAALYDSLADVDGSQLRTLRYERQRQKLSVAVAYGDYPDGQRLIAALESRGLTATISNARQAGGRVIGDLSVEAAP